MSERNLNIDDDAYKFITEIVKAGVAEGIRIGIEENQNKLINAQKNIHDNRLKNTKLLLRNYRRIVNSIDNSVFSEKDLDTLTVEDIIETVDDFDEYGVGNNRGQVILESVLKSKKRSELMIAHIKNAVDFYLYNAIKNENKGEEERARMIISMYIEGTKRKTFSEIAEEFFKSESQIRRDIEHGIDELSVHIFGVDGIRG